MNATDDLGTRYWTWRAAQQPRSPDDIPRIARPEAWQPRWSTDDITGYRDDLIDFESELAALPPTEERAELVDRRLLSSALARVRWELDVLRIWQTQPRFYVDQTIGNVFDLLTPAQPDAARLSMVIEILEQTPALLELGRDHLGGHAVGEFADTSIAELTHIRSQVAACVQALVLLPAAAGLTGRLSAAGRSAGEALASYREWLVSTRPSMSPMTPIGPVLYQWFLTEVALVPLTPAQILATGRAELDRAITLDTWERNRVETSGESVPVVQARSAEEQSADEAAAELAVRRFYVEHRLLSQPDSLQHYLNEPMPDYLAPLRWLGVTDDLTDESRVDEDGVSYVPTFVSEVPYFYAANQVDPRAGIVHEGAHYQQLALSWRHRRPIRRHYYDSMSNEGIAFYNEELMLASGLFDGTPGTRQIMYNFMRLRALRVEVDVRLALGELDMDGAAKYLEQVVPMDAVTAREEAAFFAAFPAQAITYQIGKSEIMRLFADSVRIRGAAFDLVSFHDQLWLEGNVPLALQRWEQLDDDSDLRRLEMLRPTLRFEPDNCLVVRPLVTAAEANSDLSATWVQIDGTHRRLRTNRSTRMYYVVEGTLTLDVEAREPLTLGAGECGTVARGVEYGLTGRASYLVINGPAFRDGDDEYTDIPKRGRGEDPAPASSTERLPR